MSLKNKVLVAKAVGEKNLAVVSRKNLFREKYVSGFVLMDEEELYHLISKHMVFRERTEKLEKDPKYKQIIPYFLVKQGNKYLTALRRNTGGDIRLHGRRLIGFGGHLKAGDIKGKMGDWLKREFDEEIFAEKILDIKFLGIVNHDGEEDGGLHKVHFGLVFEINTKGKVEIKEKDVFQDENFMTIKQLRDKAGEMELWSRLIITNWRS